ncbi:MAG: 50S ribosomal protein L11 methyltransferase [Geminicoccaceae bacterium]|nr:50S ribosomal protein L11 methyltransferase [Geminicoccaceae bacterium]
MSDPKGLWQASFELDLEPPPLLLEALEEMALSASIFTAAVDEADEATRWRVDLLFAEEPDATTLGAEIGALLAAHDLPAGVDVAIAWLAHQDWLEAVRMTRPPMTVGRFLVHGPDDAPPANARAVPLLIEAGLAFGSGEHATTTACLLAFDRELRRRPFARVLDMGCGSAILGIAAARVNRHTRVLAVDNDPLAVAVARDNAKKNGVAGRVACLVSEGYGDARIRRSGPFDLIFANILADPLVAMAGDLRRHLASGGAAILSGLLDRQAPAVLAAHRRQGMRSTGQVDRPPWAALVLRRSGAVRRAASKRN